MNYLYEPNDILNNPVDAFIFDTRIHAFPVQAHWHYYVEVIYMLEGNAWITCNHEAHIVTASEMIFLPPQAIHSIYATTPMPLRYVVLKFDANKINLSGDYLPKLSNIFRSANRDFTLPIMFSQKNFFNFSLDEFFTGCVNEIRDRHYGYDSYLYASISMLLIQLLRNWREAGIQIDETPPQKDQDYSIHDILMYIDAHSQENISVEDLAAMCHMSYSYFAKNFHQLYGQSCKELNSFYANLWV